MILFKIDENLPADLKQVFRDAGCDAVTVLDQAMRGSPDGDVAAICRDEGRALITLDTDFANILRYPPSQHHGIVVLRLPRTDKRTVLEAVRAVAPLFATLPLARRLLIVEEGRIRIRG